MAGILFLLDRVALYSYLQWAVRNWTEKNLNSARNMASPDAAQDSLFILPGCQHLWFVSMLTNRVSILFSCVFVSLTFLNVHFCIRTIWVQIFQCNYLPFSQDVSLTPLDFKLHLTPSPLWNTFHFKLSSVLVNFASISQTPQNCSHQFLFWNCVYYGER